MTSSSISTYFFTAKSHSLTLYTKPWPQFRYSTSLSYESKPQIPQFRYRKTSVSSIRASDVESDKLASDVRKRAMDAVDSCGRRVAIGDVASKAGLKLNEAQKALQALAADTNGFLEVSDEGDVLYVFPKDYRPKLAAKSFRMKVEPLLETGKTAVVCLVKVSFGTSLVASIIIVFIAIIVIIASGGNSEKESGSPGYTGLPCYPGYPGYFNPTTSYWGQEYDEGMKVIDSEISSLLDDDFIESAFSFVFGDGDPNQGIEEKRWKLIGQYITSNGGVVAAEELAPYLDRQSTKNMDADSYVLPVLLRFDGQPKVDEEGNILYCFPSLQRTAASRNSGQKENIESVEKFFGEKKWQFSKTSDSKRAKVIRLGAVNLFGVIILRTLLKGMEISQGGFISFVSRIFPLLKIYAASFFAIPLIRLFFILYKNAQIAKRNEAREQSARALESPDPSLRRKILSARDMAQKTFISLDRIVYSTERDVYEQDIGAQEWNHRFREIKMSD